MPGLALAGLVLALGMGGGAFASLRWVAPITAALSWRSVILRGVLAAAIGAIGVFVLRLAQSFLAAVSIGPYPFGYDFTASVNPDNLGNALLGDIGVAFAPFVYNAPLAVLACVFLKIWLSSHPGSVEAKDRASASV